MSRTESEIVGELLYLVVRSFSSTHADFTNFETAHNSVYWHSALLPPLTILFRNYFLTIKAADKINGPLINPEITLLSLWLVFLFHFIAFF